MFNFTSSMLLESTDSLFSSTKISTSQLRNENYFDTAIEEVSSIARQYTDAKKELYAGLANSTEEFKDLYSKAYETSFPKKDKDAVSESCSSTEHFISYFGKSIEIVNTAIGNMADACCRIENQTPIMQKEACKSVGKLEKSELCPACGSYPCSCKVHNEDLFKFTTEHDLEVTKVNFTGMEDAITGTDFKSKYDAMVVEAADLAANRRGKICGLDGEKISVSIFGEAVVSNYRSVNTYPINVNHRYLDYCIETINTLPERVLDLKNDVKYISKNYKDAITRLESVMYASTTGEYVKEDGTTIKLEDDETIQNMDIYCKAKVDELVHSCYDHIISLGAKLDAMRCEFDQCKAVLSKYVAGNDQPIALPEKDDIDSSNITTADAVASNQEPLQELPDETPDLGMESEYESVDYYLNHGDTRDVSAYAESYNAFLTDMLVNESILEGYINGVLLNESEQVITEGAIAKGKGLINRFINFIKKIWGKFTNSMNALFQNDMKYLSENKNIIIGNKLKNANIDKWYNYDLKRIQEDQLTAVNSKIGTIVSAQKLVADLKNTGSEFHKCGDPKNGATYTFNVLFPGQEYNNPQANNSNDKFRLYFAGQPVSRNASTITAQEMEAFYDYCYSFKSDTRAKLQKDIDTVDEICNIAMETYDQLKNEVGEDSNEPEQDKGNTNTSTQYTNPTNGNGGDGKVVADAEYKEVGEKKEASDMSSVFDQYFSEMNIGASSDPSKGDGSNQNYKPSVNAPTDDQKNQFRKDANSQSNQANTANANKEDVDAVKRCMDNIFTLLRSYVSVKLTVGQSAYNDYMKLIRWHVGQYKGTTDQQDKNGAIINNNDQQNGNDQNQ